MVISLLKCKFEEEQTRKISDKELLNYVSLSYTHERE